ncbi:MAG: purine-binding chemotaxis protein CheW [Limisphaerales bacterium]|nr:MAG: purine-binding chemotaxis protein CheW [Limisphaerales bacterium]
MSTAALDPSAVGEQSLAGKYLTFTLGHESYGIPVLKVREIIRHTNITAVPQLPDYVKGILNLRGKVIPIVDLRLKFRLGAAEIAERTCIVVVQVRRASGNRALMGLIVDGVEAVANIAARDIEPTPDFGTTLDTAYILGVAKLEGSVISLLDIDQVISAEVTELAVKSTLPT